MTATLTIAAGATTLTVPLFNGSGDPVFTLEADFSPGGLTWRRVTSTSPSIAGRVITGYVQDTPMMTGGIRCYGYGTNPELDLQTQIALVVSVLIQPTATWTYTHGVGATPAVYQWAQSEPGDCSLGQGDVIQDMEMANVMQVVRFSVPRNPIPLQGPI